MSLDQLTVSQLLDYIAKISVSAVVLTVGWKLRGVWEIIRHFIARIENHMTVMETSQVQIDRSMRLLLDNHLKHIEKAVDTLAGTTVSELVTLEDPASHSDQPQTEF